MLRFFHSLFSNAPQKNVTAILKNSTGNICNITYVCVYIMFACIHQCEAPAICMCHVCMYCIPQNIPTKWKFKKFLCIIDVPTSKRNGNICLASVWSKSNTLESNQRSNQSALCNLGGTMHVYVCMFVWLFFSVSVFSFYLILRTRLAV